MGLRGAQYFSIAQCNYQKQQSSEYVLKIWKSAVHFRTVIEAQISKFSKEFKKHLLPGYGDCNIWIIGSVSKHLKLCLCSAEGSATC